MIDHESGNIKFLLLLQPAAQLTSLFGVWEKAFFWQQSSQSKKFLSESEIREKFPIAWEILGYRHDEGVCAENHKQQSRSCLTARTSSQQSLKLVHRCQGDILPH